MGRTARPSIEGWQKATKIGNRAHKKTPQGVAPCGVVKSKKSSYR
jgi:hypothetical protein